MKDSSYNQQHYPNRNRTDGRKNSSGRRESSDSSLKEWFEENPFSNEWINDRIDSGMVKFAEEAGKYMANKRLTKSKIRSIFGEIKRIQMGTFNEEQASFLLLRPKVAYALGRDNENQGLHLFKRIFDKAADQVVDQKTFNNFCSLFEAILAYHKAYGGKDQ